MPLYPIPPSGNADDAEETQELAVYGPPPGDGAKLWQTVLEAWIGEDGAWVPTYNGIDGAGVPTSLTATHTDTLTSMTLLATFSMTAGADYTDYTIRWFDDTDALLGSGRQIVITSSPQQTHHVYYTAQSKPYTDPVYPGFNRGAGPVATSAPFTFINSTNEQ